VGRVPLAGVNIEPAGTGVVKIALLMLLSAIGTGGVFAQGLPTFKGTADLVALNVVVMDGQEQFVAGLTADSFAVYEDGVQQDLAFFAAGDLPLDLAILLDTSASMHDKLATAQQAAIGFVSGLRADDRLLVVDIKDKAAVAAPLSHDLKGAKDAILRTTAAGGTAIYNGLYVTLREMVRTRRADANMRRQAVVLLSDGDDTSSLVAYDDVMDLAKESGISIYTIMVGSQFVDANLRRVHPSAARSEYGMKALARETGARSFATADADSLSGVYTSIGRELASQYALGYTPKNQRRDGGYRRVTVRILDRTDARPRTRAGYVAPQG
jgi:Ca-activated chloride channel family protein